MSPSLGRFADRLLARFIPARTAQAVRCDCECSDKCYPCCPQNVDGVIIRVCHKELSCNP
ncbi:hypothetical protein [Phytomonospora endophytica]|uniref:Uncharacterized protein n=1 Tax=Phytomonospora endophytica TaxID=714109 RepID=A0A841F6U5_9ACTN|nr:hypothetical protein [Phytomonospora endophytica]MBB6032691.1 hypothetical protein [Phytomonospora endophytica]GIG66159.1 hypothetical protein Pen01_24540 [Phytomonospora endophytica]